MESKKIIQNPYLQYRDHIKTGDVILWKGTEPIARLIRLFSDDFSHASMVLRLEQFQGLKDRRWVLEATGKGLFPNLLSNVIPQHGEAFLFKLKEEHNDKRDELASWGMEHVGTGYDYWGVFKNIFGRISPSLHRMFCSGFIGLDFYHAKLITELEKLPRPGDIAQWCVLENLGRLGL